MRRIALGLSVLIAVAGCTADRTPPRSGAASSPAQSANASGRFNAIRPLRSTAGAAAAQRMRTGLASLPDRGELLAYDDTRKTRREGAFTSYPIALSEAHAFRAARPGGSISLRAPDGRLIRLAYERHIEHADGNWTWIGRQADGTDAVITFGEKAVYGSIEQRNGEPLQITTLASVPWLVQTDASRLGRGNDGRPGAGDFLLPSLPTTVARPRADAATPASAGLAMPGVSASATSAARTVDVVIGYTSGLATQLGGASQAATRMNNLIEITNQAYVNSGVDARVRLVATLQVNYADATDNNDALEKLTGYDSDTNANIPPDPAFSALRAAREQYGADLVSLVRAFRAPENNGCGVAWLVGGDRSAIDSRSAPFGYSVVSDGRDADGATTYFCRDETLAHELGHNMGQAHNSEDSTGDNGALSYGAHTYSFGWRESSPGCFYTVMSYRTADSCQQAIRYFGNPSILYSGRPTGVADVADNARSLNQTVPLIATFRGTVVVEQPNVVFSGAIRGVGDKCLDVRDGATGLGAAVQVWACSGVRQQQWSIANSVAGIGNVGTDKFLDIIGYGTANGTQLQLWSSTAASNQAWTYGNVALVAAGGRVIDAVDTSSADGTRMQLWDDLGGANQRWTFDPRTGRITGKDGKCLDVENFGTANGTLVQFWTCSGTQNQTWRAGGNGTLVGIGGNCLEAANAGSGNGTVVRMWACNGGAHQSWMMRGEIRSQSTGQCLDDPGFGQTNGSRVHMWTCHGGTNQRWEFSPR